MMSKISNLKEEDNVLTFTISNIDVSYANALRRTIISDIPIVVFKTSPYEENKANIIINTSRLHNEIIKQRLSCIPIHITDLSNSIKNYQVEIDVENKTDTMLYVTTKDFKIKDLTTNQYLEESVVKKIFPPFIPPDCNGEHYIDFLRLRPKFSDEIPGERIKMTCALSIDTARNDSSFNVTGTCSYGCTLDTEKIEQQVEIRKQMWKDEGKNDSEISFEVANWKLLGALRYIKQKSFDFIIQTIGIYDNFEIITKACDILLQKFTKIKDDLDKDEIKINNTVDTTMNNCYDVILENEDYTIGNILNHEVYQLFYTELDVLNYVGFKKFHPHDSDSILRMAFNDNTKGISDVKIILDKVVKISFTTLTDIKKHFSKK